MPGDSKERRGTDCKAVIYKLEYTKHCIESPDFGGFGSGHHSLQAKALYRALGEMLFISRSIPWATEFSRLLDFTTYWKLHVQSEARATRRK